GDGEHDPRRRGSPGLPGAGGDLPGAGARGAGRQPRAGAGLRPDRPPGGRRVTAAPSLDHPEAPAPEPTTAGGPDRRRSAPRFPLIGWIGLAIVAAFVGFALVGPWLSPYRTTQLAG